jgi:hypothetical protein
MSSPLVTLSSRSVGDTALTNDIAVFFDVLHDSIVPTLADLSSKELSVTFEESFQGHGLGMKEALGRFATALHESEKTREEEEEKL